MGERRELKRKINGKQPFFPLFSETESVCMRISQILTNSKAAVLGEMIFWRVQKSFVCVKPGNTLTSDTQLISISLCLFLQIIYGICLLLFTSTSTILV